MNHKELVAKIKPGTKLKIKDVPYTVSQHIVWMQHRANYPYDKWVLVDEKGYDGYRLFIEANEPAMGFAKIFHHEFQEPMPDKLNFEGKAYKKVWDEFCTVERVEGNGIYKKGDGEIWWDYVSEDNKNEGLSLGRSWETWEREDLKTQCLELGDVEITAKSALPQNMLY
ncbi:DUF4178 domain-containing protein [Patescibacteria group bacterium]|nr:DUF4178 domain-containing protein [Patescibacteria group bacterium]